MHPHTTAQILHEINLSVQSNKRKGLNTIVGICGGSCSGKSSVVAEELHRQSPSPSKLLHQDNFQKGKLALHHCDEIYRWDAPSHYNIYESSERLNKLKHNTPVNFPVFDFSTQQSIRDEKITPSNLIFFEGIYAAYGSLLNVMDYIVYVDVPFHARFIRRLFRNSYKRYSRDPKDVCAGILSGGVFKAHYDLIVHQKKKAHKVVFNPFNFNQIIDAYQLQEQKLPKIHHCILDYKIDHQFSMKVVAVKGGETFLIFCKAEKLYFKLPIDQESIMWLKYWIGVDQNFILKEILNNSFKHTQI